MKDKEQELKLGLQTAVEILHRYHIVTKTAKIYQASNLLFQEHVKILFSLIQAFHKRSTEVVFDVRHHSVYFNGMRLKFGFIHFHIFRFCVEEFKKRNIGTLGFKPGITADELSAFMILFSRREAAKDLNCQELQTEIEKRSLKHILLKTLPTQDFMTNRDRDAVKIYFLSLFHLKQILFHQVGQEEPDMKITERLIQSLHNHLCDHESFFLGLTTMKNYDDYTLNHSVNVCMLSIALGRRLGLDRAQLVELGISAFLHDMGKVETPKEILNKPASLSYEERAIIEKHPQKGAEKLFRLQGVVSLPLHAVNVALEHHVKEDFTGYPRTFMKKTLNLYSRIVKVVDYFDALTTVRPYRPQAYTRDEAVRLMLRQEEAEFHPLILKVFANMMGAYPVGTVTLLDTGEIGIVFEINPEPSAILRPSVKIIADSNGNRIDGEIVDLMEKDLDTGLFKKTILRTLDPERYGIHVPHYFIARAMAQ